jgi:putative ATPase
MNESIFQPLATRMRPRTIEEFVGQSHLLGPQKPLQKAIALKNIHSMILWGPPGCGKTTLAKLLAANANATIEQLSAITSGVKDIREVTERAKDAQKNGQKTVLFVDEVHRFNKAQQDAFLPQLENGTFSLIGTTTENPSFALNNALLSRTRVYVLQRLNETEILELIEQALKDTERGLGNRDILFPIEQQQRLAKAADGDARQALSLLEIAADFTEEREGREWLTEQTLTEILKTGVRRFDKQGEAFYDQISALHKSIRGSSPDAALYWFCRMVDGGCDPQYILRRLLRAASEDIGNADPRALALTLDAAHVYERLGSPEGELAIAQAIIYLACAAKSNASYVAFNAAMQDAKEQGSLDVPLHLRNAPTRLMKELGYGKDYRYAHDEPDAYAAGEHYFPDEMPDKNYYHPTERGLEIKISEKLAQLRALVRQQKCSTSPTKRK